MEDIIVLALVMIAVVVYFWLFFIRNKQENSSVDMASYKNAEELGLNKIAVGPPVGVAGLTVLDTVPVAAASKPRAKKLARSKAPTKPKAK